eukprot:scaffold10027_cov114-Isochrysis_galbana.AAC.2
MFGSITASEVADIIEERAGAAGAKQKQRPRARSLAYLVVTRRGLCTTRASPHPSLKPGRTPCTAPPPCTTTASGVTVDKKGITTPKLKAVGSEVISVVLHKRVEATIKISVVPATL